mgnify:CR=1 FL=1
MRPFKCVNSTRKKSAEVARQIVRAIREGTYKPGDKLPTQRDLAEQMGVSRNSVREALSALEILGIVESKVGSGTYISSSLQEQTVIDDIFLRPKATDDVLDLWEARKEIEAVIVKLASEFASKKSISRIQYALDRMHEALEKDDAVEYLELDKIFHLAIAKACDNALLESIITPLIFITNDYLTETLQEHKLLERCRHSIQEHKDIFLAIKKGDARGGIKAVRDHFTNVESFFGRKFW